VIKVDRLRFSRVSRQDRTFSLARAFAFNRDHDTPQQARGGHIVFHERQQRANILAGMPHNKRVHRMCFVLYSSANYSILSTILPYPGNLKIFNYL